jgi:lysophospholipase L1-like esterase
MHMAALDIGATVALDYTFTAEEIESARGFESEIADFERGDAKNGAPQNAVVFLGSSTLRLWINLVRNFAGVLPDVPILNRGFGGSQVSDSLFYIERVLLPYAPRAVVFYAGDNDLAHGKTPQRVFEGTRALCERTWQDFPETKFFLVSVKPSPSRWNIFDLQTEANDLLREYCAGDARLKFVDIVTPMLSADGALRPELYVADELHLSLAGYRIWREVLAPHLAALAE